jgi:hypothetical protein
MSKDMSVLDQRKSNPNDDEDENHYNTPRPGTPRFGQDPELSSDTSEEAMVSEEVMEALGECLGLIQPPTDRISAPQGASAKPRPQFTGQNCSQVHNHSVVEANDYTFGPYAPNQNQTFGPRIQNPNQTFGPQSQNQNLGHNPNRTLGPKALSQNVSQNPNQTFGPQGQSQNYDFAVLTYNIQTW